VGEAGALVVIGEDEDLRLAGQATERRRVEDAVAVTLETGAVRVGLLRGVAGSRTGGTGGERGQLAVGGFLTEVTVGDVARSGACPGVGMGHRDAV